MFRRPLIIFALLAALAFLPSCLDEPVKPIKEGPALEWPGRATEEEAVDLLLTCYANPRSAEVMTEYEALLHSEYFFLLAPDDVDVGESRFILREEDIASTKWLFENQSVLNLALSGSGDWHDYPELNGKACEGCRETMRSYYIRVQFGASGQIYTSSTAEVHATIIVAPDESDPAKWVIRAIYDHGL